jgi:hypothetical protein
MMAPPMQPAATSIDDAVKRAFAAMSDGDADALVDGTGISTVKKYTDCSDVDDAVEKRELEDLEHEMARLANREKGATFDVVSIDEHKSPIRIHTGDAMGKHCKTTTEIAAHPVDIKLRVTRAGTTYDQPATSQVIEVDGKFFVVNAPKMPGCSAAIARVQVIAERDHDTRNLDVDTCVTQHWSQTSIDCMSHALMMSDVDACIAKRQG